jgi:hypothetical protein
MTAVPANVPSAPNSTSTVANPLKWLVGLTAGYFSQLNLVQVLNMILFPPVPASYTSPSLSLSIDNGNLRAVGTTFSVLLTLSYTRASSGTASFYTFKRTLPTVSTLITLTNSSISTNSFTTGTVSQTIYTSTPTLYTYTGTASHLGGVQLYDTYGNPTPIPSAVQQVDNMSPSPTTVSVRTIFPYYVGKVGQTTTTASFAASDVTTYGTPYVAQSNVALSNINFNTNNVEKGFLAIPTAAGDQTVVTYTAWVDNVVPSNNGYIPGGAGSLFIGSPFNVSGVVVNGISHTYTIYLFDYPSSSLNSWTFEP